MPRIARKKSQTGIYHIILRGINRQSIFEDDEDRGKLLQTLLRYKEKCEYNIYAYCFMGNHFHLLLKDENDQLPQIMRRICGSYVYWYNHKYERIGNLFQGRFKSEPVETDSYFLTVIRYIHQNPLKAKIVPDISEYRWSSYNEYIMDKKLVDTEYVLNMFNQDYPKAKELFRRFNTEQNQDECLEIEEKKKKISDNDLRNLIQKEFDIQSIMIQNET